MTAVEQVLRSIGMPKDGARRLARGSRSVGRTARDFRDRMPQSAVTPFPWMGIAVAAGVAFLLLRRRLSGGARVRDVMVSDVLTVEPTAMLLEAAQKMREGNVGMLPVVEYGALRGIVTDRDLVVRAMAHGADATSTRVTECMTRSVTAARPDWTVEEAMRLMRESQVGRLPVVNDQDRVVGVVTLSSLALRSRGDDEALQAAKHVSRRSARIA